MAELKDVTKGRFLAGLAVGAGLVWLGPKLAPMVRPGTRSALKSGILLYEIGREWWARAGEEISDLRAEVLSELSAEEGTAAHTSPEGGEAAGQD